MFLKWSGIHHLKRSWSSLIHQYAQVLCILLSVWTTIKLRSHVVLKIFRYNPILRLLSLTHHNPAAVEHFLDFSKCSKKILTNCLPTSVPPPPMKNTTSLPHFNTAPVFNQQDWLMRAEIQISHKSCLFCMLVWQGKGYMDSTINNSVYFHCNFSTFFPAEVDELMGCISTVNVWQGQG